LQGRGIQVVAFDMDGVLTVNTSSWELLHKCMGTHPSLKACRFSEAFLRGLITYEDWMRLDLEIMMSSYGGSINIGELRRRLISNLKLDPDARYVINKLRSAGVKVYIVSAGIDVVAKYLASELGLSNDEVFVNKLVSKHDGDLMPYGVGIVNPLRKYEILERISHLLNIPLSDFAYVGDTSWDLNAFRVVGYPILYVRDLMRRFGHSDEEEIHNILIPGMVIITKLSELIDIIEKVNDTKL